MALPINIDDLIHGRVVESSRIEYKADWNPEPIIHTITAFANDFDNLGGGYILVGIAEENGTPKMPLSGLPKEKIDVIQKDLFKKCNAIEPRYIPIAEPYVIDGKSIIVIWVPGGDERPYKCPIKIYTEKGQLKSNKAYYIRKMSNTIRANTHEERELIALARNVPFDDRINQEAAIGDMSLALVREYLCNVGSSMQANLSNRSMEDIALDMKLVKGPKEMRKPVNVGLMFFNDKPDDFFPYTRIEVVDKPDPTGIGMTERIFRGPLNRQLRDALSYIRNCVIIEYVTKVPDQAEAVRVFNWPYTAIEEALTNAVYHRSYEIYEPITVTITPEQLDILSVPGPDRSITDEDMAKGVMVSNRYRNRRIGDFLKELKMAEARNTGVPLIFSAMKNNGSGLPIFKTDEDRSYLRVILPIHPIFLEKDSPRAARINKAVSRQKRARMTREDIRNQILKLLKRKGPLSMREIAVNLGYLKLTDTVREVIKELLASGKAEYLYPDTPQSSNQKIRLPQDK